VDERKRVEREFLPVTETTNHECGIDHAPVNKPENQIGLKKIMLYLFHDIYT